MFYSLFADILQKINIKVADLFAPRQVDKDPHAEPPQKMLTLYEMDLGLNHVTRKFADAVDHSSWVKFGDVWHFLRQPFLEMVSH